MGLAHSHCSAATAVMNREGEKHGQEQEQEEDDGGDDMSTLTHFSTTFTNKRRDLDNVFFKDWFIILVGGFLEFEDLGRWDVAMCSRREEWLEGLSNVKIADVNKYPHHRNESVRWLISRRIRHVTKIIFGKCRSSQICSRTFSGARALVNLKSIIIMECNSDSIMASLKVNCPNLEELEIVCDSVGYKSSFIAAADMVEELPRLRCLTFTRDEESLDYIFKYSERIKQSSTPLLLALAKYCPLLESLNLVRYDDEGLAELVAGCPNLCTLTINADMAGVTLAGFRALGRSRVTSLRINTFVIDKVEEALLTMAEEGMPIKTLNLYSCYHYDDLAFLHSESVSVIVQFAPTLENLTLRHLSSIDDEDLEVLSQCHKLRSIEIENAEAGFEADSYYGKITGAFLIPMSIGCPLLEKVYVSEIIRDDPEAEPVDVIDFKPFFERCPNLKYFSLDIRTDEEVKALVQHCPLVEYIKLGSSVSECTIPQELSRISDVSLIAIARGLHFVKHISLYCTQCTNAGLRALVATGECRRVLGSFHVQNGSWKEGYPQLITQKGKEELMAALKIPPNTLEVPLYTYYEYQYMSKTLIHVYF